MKRRASIRPWLTPGILAVLLLVGCSQRTDGPKLYAVSGIVRVDEEPLREGTITFVPQDGIGAAYGASILDGKFQINLSAGPKAILIEAYQVSSKLVGPAGEPVSEQYLPAQYNSKSTLSATITVEPKQELTFDLRSE